MPMPLCKQAKLAKNLSLQAHQSALAALENHPDFSTSTYRLQIARSA
jgi:hypothetical protein